MEVPIEIFEKKVEAILMASKVPGFSVAVSRDVRRISIELLTGDPKTEFILDEEHYRAIEKEFWNYDLFSWIVEFKPTQPYDSSDNYMFDFTYDARNIKTDLSYRTPKTETDLLKAGFRKRFENDAVAHPAHYNDGKIEVIEFIEDKKLGFHLGNTVKYICRAGKKDPTKTIEDLEKASWYLRREIECRKAMKDDRSAIKPDDMKKE